MSDGNVLCWGNEVTTPQALPNIDGTAIDLTMGMGKCVRRTTGDVTCIGASFLRPVAARDGSHTIPELRGASRVELGQAAGCAYWDDGVMKCWGTGLVRLLTGENAMGAHPVTIADATQLATADDFACLLLTTGEVKCLGGNHSGQLGDGTTISRAELDLVLGLPPAAEVHVGMMHACALTRANEVWCWGANHTGQLGRGAPKISGQPVRVPGLRNTVALSLGDHHACALDGDGTVRCWGWNNAGQLGRGMTSDYDEDPAPVVALTGVKQLVSGMKFSCALLTDGQVACWGDNWLGQLGDGFKQAQSRPTRVRWTKPKPTGSPKPPASVRSLAVGFNRTCATLVDGTAWCWGDGTRKPTQRVDLSEVAYVSAETPRLSLFEDGELRASGRTVATKVKQVARGSEHACVLLDDATVRCFGRNSGGLLGDGTDIDRRGQLVDPKLNDVTQIALNHATTCAVRKDGSLHCWGFNGHGAVGDGTSVDRMSPVQVPGLSDVVEVEAGLQHMCARTSDKRVQCWGYAPALARDRAPWGKPVKMKGVEDVIDMSAGNDITCARHGSGRVSCWGRDYQDPSELAPRDVPWLRDARDLALGMQHGCALMPDGTVVCWGENENGQLGDGTNTSRATGVTVLWPK